MEDMVDYQCRPHGLDYIFWGPSNMEITKQIDPLSRIDTWHIYWLRNAPQDFIIHVGDHVPEPSPLAADSWFGFASGQWQGDVLKVEVTHLKRNFIKRNGVPRSGKAHDTLYFMRHGDILDVFVIVYDPLYLTEPFTRAISFQ